MQTQQGHCVLPQKAHRCAQRTFSPNMVGLDQLLLLLFLLPRPVVNTLTAKILISAEIAPATLLLVVVGVADVSSAEWEAWSDASNRV
mmetsp:Transcript_65210/g.139616  ORF Transcript_65210/g.139616 Transcript_65210/m.139616 type:complete len:88 (-) Transcript_65210:27-290(-)